MDATLFGVKLKALRKNAGMTQHELAEKSGVTRSAIAKFELGDREPLLATAQKLAHALGEDCTAFTEPAPTKAAKVRKTRKGK